MQSPESRDDLKTLCFYAERGPPAPAPGESAPGTVQKLALVRTALLYARLREPGRRVRWFELGKPWITIGGPHDDIALADPAAGPGQIVLKPQGGQVFLECSPLSTGVRLGGHAVYRAILRPGDRFRIGRAQIDIAGSRQGPEASLSLVSRGGAAVPMVRARAEAALARAQPQLERIRRGIELVRAQPRPRRVALAAAALALSGAVCTTHLTVSADCELVPEERTFLRAPVAGFVREVRVREGERVHKGDLLLTVSIPDVDRDLARLGHEIEAARAQLAQAERGARPTELLMAEARQRAAQTRALFLERQQERVARLARQGLESRQALEDAVREAEGARAEAELAQLGVAHLEQGSAPEEVAQKRAELAKLDGERDFLERQRGRAEIRSPSDGVVATPRPTELESKYVTPGAELLVVLDGAGLLFEAKVPEKEIEFVQAGAPVKLRLKGDPEHPVPGVVEEIAPRADETPTGRVVSVRCRATEVPHASLAGLSGVAHIRGQKVTWLALLAKRMVRWVRADLL